MTTNASFDDRLAAWLQEDSEHRVPDHLGEVLELTQPMRQRAWWSSPERWLPVETTLRLVPAPRYRWLLVAVAVLIALGIAIAFGVGSQRRLPPPFGIARNGAVVHEANGDIVSLDPATNRSTTIIGGADNDRSPRLSRDGTTIGFDRELSGARHQLMVANSDGTGARPVGPPITEMDPIVWSPDGTRVAVDSVIDGRTAVRTIGLDGIVTIVLPQELGTPTEAVQDIQWRPDGQSLLLRAWTPAGPFGLWTVRADGTGLHRILPTTDLYRESYWPALSPDGTTVAYSFIDEGRIRMIDIDKGLDRTVRFGGTGADFAPVWSPDGSRLAFRRTSSFDGAGHMVIASAAGGPVVEAGPAFPDSNGPKVAFSPDGRTLIAWYPATNLTWLLDPAGGPGQVLSFGSTDLASWQRLAP